MQKKQNHSHDETCGSCMVGNACTWNLDGLWKLYARISPLPAFSNSKGNFQRRASESYSWCSSKSEPALAGTVKPWLPGLDPAEDWAIYTRRLGNPLQKGDLTLGTQGCSFWTPEKQTCFPLPPLPRWQHSPSPALCVHIQRTRCPNWQSKAVWEYWAF